MKQEILFAVLAAQRCHNSHGNTKYTVRIYNTQYCILYSY